MPKIKPCLWFNDNGEEAIKYYTFVFKNSTVGNVSRYGDAGPGPKGSMVIGTFTLEGQEIMILNGGPHYKLSPAFSLVVNCETQEEVDHYWDTLISDGGRPSRCGWLDDKFGVSWQIVPTMLGELMSKGEPEKSNRMMQALLKMDKLIIADLRKAYDGE
jgi:predicted 3-demethylubiquinone-9 3-methyltransferase (glyoxalase superfamily)